jgi:hypothetical protein
VSGGVLWRGGGVSRSSRGGWGVATSQRFQTADHRLSQPGSRDQGNGTWQGPERGGPVRLSGLLLRHALSCCAMLCLAGRTLRSSLLVGLGAVGSNRWGLQAQLRLPQLLLVHGVVGCDLC